MESLKVEPNGGGLGPSAGSVRSPRAYSCGPLVCLLIAVAI